MGTAARRTALRYLQELLRRGRRKPGGCVVLGKGVKDSRAQVLAEGGRWSQEGGR